MTSEKMVVGRSSWSARRGPAVRLIRGGWTIPRTNDPARQRRANDSLDSDLLQVSDVTRKTGFGCSVLRRARIKVFVLCPLVKEVVCLGGRWETTPCTGPLLSPLEREAGVCESCAAGWEADMNRLATPEEVAEYEALAAGVAEERRRGMSNGPRVRRIVQGGARPGPLRHHEQGEIGRVAAGI